MSKFERGPLDTYEIIWASGQVEHIQAHQVIAPPSDIMAGIFGGATATKKRDGLDVPRRGRWRLEVAAVRTGRGHHHDPQRHPHSRHGGRCVMSTRYVWRLVVDSWPTEDGNPFSAQGYTYWDGIACAFESGEPVPSWVPDLRPWLTHGDEAPQRQGHVVAYDDPPDPATGYPGYPEYVMNVPTAPTRTYLSRSSVAERLADLLAWGCEARIERAPIGEWEDVA